jgi:methionyl-tRNA formyltransferase
MIIILIFNHKKHIIMKLLLCLNHDIFSIIALNLLLPFLEENNVNFNIVMTKSVGQAVISDITKIEKIIPLEGVLPTLDSLNITGHYLSLDAIIKKYACDFHFVTTINNDFGLTRIAQHDLIVSVRFGSIFKQPAISQAKNPIINLHSAILPDYKGILGTFRALKDRNEGIGATIHTISDSSIDTGNIIEIIHFEANYETTLFDNLRNLYQKTIPVLGDIITQIINGDTPQSHPQDTTKGQYFSSPTITEIENFKQNIMPIYNNNDIETMIGLFALPKS